MLHMMKLAVGARDLDDLRAWQTDRAIIEPPLRHRTRARPKRAADILAGGSLYWVLAGKMRVRQRVLDIINDVFEDGSACAGIVLDPTLVEVEMRLTKPFQGWRYLAAEAAPADLGAPVRAQIDTDLPEQMRRDLRELCLL